jgi:hypothetical protein
MPSIIRQLTERHRQAQLRIGATVIQQLQTVWGLLDPEDLDGTFDDWLAVVLPIVDNGRAASSELAASYLGGLRVLQLGEPFAAVRADPVDRARLATSMLVTGPISIRSNLGRLTLSAAADLALARSASAGMRHVLNGGRETITATIQADRRAVGYERVTSGNACAFCSMLEGRGAVYSEESAGFEAHDGCGCTAEPVYR